MTQKRYVSILSLDAWGNEDDGFEWNDWHKVGEVGLDVLDKPESEIRAWLVSKGYLTTGDPVLFSIKDDDYNLLICDVADGNRPIYALAYGEATL